MQRTEQNKCRSPGHQGGAPKAFFPKKLIRQSQQVVGEKKSDDLPEDFDNLPKNFHRPKGLTNAVTVSNTVLTGPFLPARDHARRENGRNISFSEDLVYAVSHGCRIVQICRRSME